jgi:hypothetical protein
VLHLCCNLNGNVSLLLAIFVILFFLPGLYPLSVTVISSLFPFFKLNPSTSGLDNTNTELESADVTVTAKSVFNPYCILWLRLMH